MQISIKNKLLILFITVIFSVTSITLPCRTGFADDTNPEPLKEIPGQKLLANGNLPELDSVISDVASVTQESVYSGSEYSVKFKLSSAITFTFDTDVNWTEYSSINIRWRADMPGQVLNIVFANSNPINVKPYARIMGGPTEEWGEYSLPVSRFADYYQYSDSGNCISVLQISGSGWNNTAYDRECTVYIDSVYLKSSDSGKEMNVPLSNVDGLTAVNPDIHGDKSVCFTFEDKLYDTDYFPLVSVTEDGIELSEASYSVMADENELWIIFKDLLKNNSSYKISLASPDKIYSHLGKVLRENVSREFTVSCGSGFVSFGSAWLSTGDELSVQFFSFEEACEKAVCAYGDDGRILASKVCADDSDSVIISVPDNASYVKAYIADETGSPLYYALLDSTGKTNVSLRDTTPHIDWVSQNTGTVTGVDASGTASAGGVPLMVKVLAEEGSELVCEPIVTKADGTFDYKYIFGSENLSGKYNVRFIMAGSDTGYTIAYVDPEAAAEFVEIANSGKTEEIEKWMTDNLSVIPDSISTKASIKDAALILSENTPFDSYDSLSEILMKITGTIDVLNDILWSDLADYIEENNDFLIEEDSDYYSYFIDLSAKNRNLICKDIVDDTPFETLSDFRTSFDSAVKKYKSDKSSGGSSGGGSGGGKTTSRTTVSVVTTPETVPPAEQKPVETPESQTPEIPFTDLDGYEWAKDDILMLHSKGIISSAEDKCYRPQESVKREELVKMIVEAFLKNKNASGHKFSDAADNAWYNLYLDAAYQNGIILGKPDGSFGIGENVSREDMAVMLYRALSSLGLKLTPGDTAVFIDSADISGYAVEAVGAMAESGVISGMGDGTFSPETNANRAQAAKVIANLLKTYEGSLTE